MAQLSRARDRTMHSIVATIQAEQDKAIRAPSKGVVSISGGPGTGKTVVALHRAAYLLYSDRRRYESGGVLIIGPSGVFMRYIERVLPSLGETAVALRSLGEVVDGLRSFRHDEPAVADVKGAARMAELLRRTARVGGAGRARHSCGCSTATTTSCSSPRELARVRRQLLSQGKRNRQVPRVASALLDAMWRQVRGDRGRERGRDEFNDTMLGTAVVRGLRAGLVAGARRDRGARLAARPRAAGAGRRGRARRPTQQALLSKSWGPVREPRGLPRHPRRLVGAGRAAARRAAVPARRRAGEAAARRPRRRPGPAGAPVRRERPRADHGRRAGQPERRRGRRRASRTTSTPTCSSTRRRTSRRCSGGWSAAAAATPPGPSSATRRSRRGRCPAEAARAREEALGDKARHDFHLSTNYRNSKEIYDFAAGLRRRGSASTPTCPNAVRETGVDPSERTVVDLRDGRARGGRRAGRRRRGHGRDRRTRSRGATRCRAGSTAGRTSPTAAAGGS